MPKGSCWCQKVRYEYVTPSETVNVICHCPSCRKITSSAFSTCISVPRSALQILSGSEVLKTYTQSHVPTGMPLTIHFCSCCAMTLYKEAASEELRDVYIIFTGTLDWEGDKLGIDAEAPSQELWVPYKANWLPALHEAKQWDGFPK